MKTDRLMLMALNGGFWPIFACHPAIIAAYFTSVYGLIPDSRRVGHHKYRCLCDSPRQHHFRLRGKLRRAHSPIIWRRTLAPDTTGFLMWLTKEHSFSSMLRTFVLHRCCHD